MLNCLKISLCLLICVKTLTRCCDCNLEEMVKDTVIHNSSTAMEKRQLQEDDESSESSDSYENSDFSETTETTTAKTKTTKIIAVTEFKLSTETIKEHGLKNGCLFYKDAPKFNFDKMIDVWQIVFYRASETLSCFKIHIKKTTMENRKILHKKYGNFNRTINWKNCQFEVVPSAGRSEERHFLQGTRKDKGVLENIIVAREEESDTVTFLEQSPDQWLIVKNLLLMRDCDNGDVVVFSRLPMEPSHRDIEDALRSFGEDADNGTLACETLRDPKYHTLS